MKLYVSIEEEKRRHTIALEQINGLCELEPLNLPGRFVFVPICSHRLVVKTIEELHEARAILRRHYDWKDKVKNKFFACGNIIVTYAPEKNVKLPLPFEIWVEAPKKSFPLTLLGDCELVKVEEQEVDYRVVCKVGKQKN